MILDDLQTGHHYEDVEGNVRRIDVIEKGTPGVVHYTVTECITWPSHIGRSYTACPKYFAGLAIATLEPKAKS